MPLNLVPGLVGQSMARAAEVAADELEKPLTLWRERCRFLRGGVRLDRLVEIAAEHQIGLPLGERFFTGLGGLADTTIWMRPPHERSDSVGAHHDGADAIEGRGCCPRCGVPRRRRPLRRVPHLGDGVGDGSSYRFGVGLGVVVEHGGSNSCNPTDPTRLGPQPQPSSRAWGPLPHAGPSPGSR